MAYPAATGYGVDDLDWLRDDLGIAHIELDPWGVSSCGLLHVHASGRLRRAEARALYAEGMTMEKIAALFGVTRQRVSVLLHYGAQQ